MFLQLRMPYRCSFLLYLYPHSLKFSSRSCAGAIATRRDGLRNLSTAGPHPILEIIWQIPIDYQYDAPSIPIRRRRGHAYAERPWGGGVAASRTSKPIPTFTTLYILNGLPKNDHCPPLRCHLYTRSRRVPHGRPKHAAHGRYNLPPLLQ